MEDYELWQHQDEGLVVLLSDQGIQQFSVPVPLDEHLTVGPRFHLKPLLQLLTDGSDYWVLTLTAGQVLLLRGSRFAVVEDDTIELPASLDNTAAASDYENPVQAPPVAWPNTGCINIANAQVYGDIPAEWRKAQLVDFARQVAAAIDAVATKSGLPVVVVADTELSGHFQQASALGSQLAGTVDTNPAALDDTQLHDVAYAVMQTQLERVKDDLVEQFAALHGRRDPLAVTDAAVVAAAAHRGRIEVLLLRLAAAVHGSYDAATGTVSLQPDGVELVADTAFADAFRRRAHLPDRTYRLPRGRAHGGRPALLTRLSCRLRGVGSCDRTEEWWADAAAGEGDEGPRFGARWSGG